MVQYHLYLVSFARHFDGVVLKGDGIACRYALWAFINESKLKMESSILLRIFVGCPVESVLLGTMLV